MYDGTNWILLNTTGECTTGNTYTIDDASVVASRGAEIFNNYIDNVATGILPTPRAMRRMQLAVIRTPRAGGQAREEHRRTPKGIPRMQMCTVATRAGN